MGIKDTPYVIVRHFDKAHPHCHLVISRIDNNGKIIKATTNCKRNIEVCKFLNSKYSLNTGKDKLSVDTRKLRGREKARYEIAQTIAALVTNDAIYQWSTFEKELNRRGITVKKKMSADGKNLQSLVYAKGKYSFASSKIDSRFTFGQISRWLKANMSVHPDSQYAFIDGSPRPLNSYLGVTLTAEQTRDYVAGKGIRIEGCTGNHPVILMRYNRDTLRPEVSLPR